ncbi:MAG: type I methionyl aminopeptidase [Clostridia bacterium]|jgi:methionyl aminopeptidase|nr:type I methionyl aminopeptidase [Clostridia bacterium]
MIHIKSEEEIELLREPCAIVRDCLSFIGERIRAGMTTKEVDALVYDFIKASGAEPSCLGYYGFPASACVSVNEVVVHGIPDGRTIEEGDIVSVDLCAYKNGFHGDGARTFLIGKVSESREKLVRVTEECFFKAIEHLKAGSPLYDIGYEVQRHAESNGFSVIRSYTGHGIGRDMHEDPSVPNFGRKGTGVRLPANTVLCIEPMIAEGGFRVEVLDDGWTAVMRDRKSAAHYENTVLVRENGVEILTL